MPSTDGATKPETEQGASRVRRRLQTGQPGGSEGRSGCLMLGALLGVIAGIMVGLYALPPILKSIYGVESVARFDTYSGNGKHIRVLAVQSPPTSAVSPDSIVVTLSVAADERWETSAEKWRLELADGERLEGLIVAPEPAVFEAGVPGQLVLRFPLLPGHEPVPEYLHLGGPRVRFELGERGP
jgi:hypothetical protein